MTHKLLPVKVDYVFKKLFGESGSEVILKPFLSAVLRQDIDDLEILTNHIFLPEYEDEKTSIIDVLRDSTKAKSCILKSNLIIDTIIARGVFSICVRFIPIV